MIPHIHSIVGSGEKIGQGVACRVSPFSGFITTEFYDGALEGFARLAATGQLVFFSKGLVGRKTRQSRVRGIRISNSRPQGRGARAICLLRALVASHGLVHATLASGSRCRRPPETFCSARGLCDVHAHSLQEHHRRDLRPARRQ